jgi:hypothetical protein
LALLEVVSDLNLETNYEQIHEFLVGKEKVISPKTEEEISKKFMEIVYRLSVKRPVSAFVIRLRFPG